VQTDKVQCYEPATMKYLGYFPALAPQEVFDATAIVFSLQINVSSFALIYIYLLVLLYVMLG
jgi:hypothetical protein